MGISKYSHMQWYKSRNAVKYNNLKISGCESDVYRCQILPTQVDHLAVDVNMYMRCEHILRLEMRKLFMFVAHLQVNKDETCMSDVRDTGINC